MDFLLSEFKFFRQVDQFIQEIVIQTDVQKYRQEPDESHVEPVRVNVPAE